MNRDWIAAEFSKGIAAEEELAAEAKARAESPPDPALAVLYHEIAEADGRHRAVIETIAIRYGHAPSKAGGGGLGGVIGRIKDRVGEIGSSPLRRLGHDLNAKANSVHWMTAWVHTFEALGESASARELAEVLKEESTHRDALQQGLNRMVEHGARTGAAVGDP